MTRYSKLYALFCILWSVVFFSVLHWALFDQESRWPFILAAAITYGVGFGMMGALLGRHDSARNSRYSLEKVYALTSNSISFLVGGLWIIFFRGTHWWELLIAAFCLIISTVLIFIGLRGRVHGLKKEKLFK